METAGFRLVMLRRVGNVCLLVWMVIVKFYRAIVGKRKHETKNGSSEDKGWKTDWEEWGMPTEVKVESTTPTTNELETPDLFKDMAPVIHTAKKIQLKGTRNNRPSPNLNQFAVDPTFTTTSSELLDWSDEEIPEGSWGDKEDSDLPELLRQSRRQTAGRKKRDPKDKQMNTLTAGAGPVGLGATRIAQ